MTTRQVFEQDLIDLHTEIIRMGALVETAIANAVTALETMDPELAAATSRADDAIDDMEKSIEHFSLEIIALQQPVARDLRGADRVPADIGIQ